MHTAAANNWNILKSDVLPKRHMHSIQYCTDHQITICIYLCSISKWILILFTGSDIDEEFLSYCKILFQLLICTIIPETSTRKNVVAEFAVSVWQLFILDNVVVTLWTAIYYLQVRIPLSKFKMAALQTTVAEHHISVHLQNFELEQGSVNYAPLLSPKSGLVHASGVSAPLFSK